MPEQFDLNGFSRQFQHSEQRGRSPQARQLDNLRGIVLTNGDLNGRISQMPALARSKLAETVAKRLREQSTTASWADYLDWQTMAYLLHALDERRYGTLQSAIVTNTRAALAQIDAEWPDNGDLGIFQNRFDATYRLLSLQRHSAARELCVKKLVDLDAAIQRRNGTAIRSFVHRSLARSQKTESDLRGEAPNDAMRKSVQALAAVQELPLRLQRGQYTYEHRDRNGNLSHWTIEIYDSLSNICSLRCIENQDMMIAVNSLREFLEVLEHNRLPTLVQRAIDSHHRENSVRSRKTIESYDLPHNQPVAHLRLFPHSYDPIVSGGLLTSSLATTALHHRYPNLQTHPMIFSDSPKDDLISAIESIRRNGNGPRHFCIDIFSHGERNYLCFAERLTARDLMDIVRRFPDCQFTFATMACFGGGLREGVQKELISDPTIRDRVSVFLQTGGSNYNIPTHGAPSATNYYLHFIDALYDRNIRGYGSAARRADRSVKRYMPLDAEAIIRGVHVGRGPMRLDQTDGPIIST